MIQVTTFWVATAAGSRGEPMGGTKTSGADAANERTLRVLCVLCHRADRARGLGIRRGLGTTALTALYS
jgi:hypothetical protein